LRLSRLFTSHLKNDFQLDRGAEGKACRRRRLSGKRCLFRTRPAATPKRHRRLSAGRGYLPRRPPTRQAGRYASLCQRYQVLPRDSEDIERCEMSRLAPRFHIELCADAPNKFRSATFCGSIPLRKRQIARLHRFHIGTERLRRRGGARSQVLPTAARRARNLGGSPFASVRPAVDVQHLARNMRGFGQKNHGIHDLLNGRNASHRG
jgi:hypothetical protein